MRGGIWVLNGFAAIWGAGGILAGYGATWLAAVPVAISAALLVWGSRQRGGGGMPVEGGHVGRLVAIATAIEGVAIFLAADLVQRTHRPTLLAPAIAVIVGLHFLPLARWIPVRVYYLTGAGLIAVGLAASLLPAADRTMVTGLAAALVLWASGILLARKGRG